jgi:hypothetical protein
VDLAAIDHLTTNKSIVIGNSHGIHVARVHVIDVAYVRVEDIRVANVGVVDIDDRDEIPAATKPREKRFAVAERKPADSNIKTAAKEPHKSRPVDRSTVDRPRAPAPPATDVRPAAIVVGGKAPG